MRDRFSCLSGSDNDVDNQLLLTYIIKRYANKQGTYFVRHLKGNSKNRFRNWLTAMRPEQKLHMRSCIQRRWNWMTMRLSPMIHQSVELFGRWLQIIYHIISNQSEAHILLTIGILRHISCLRMEYFFEASILLTHGIMNLGISMNLS
jgi:hypothetical protein